MKCVCHLTVGFEWMLACVRSFPVFVCFFFVHLSFVFCDSSRFCCCITSFCLLAWLWVFLYRRFIFTVLLPHTAYKMYAYATHTNSHSNEHWRMNCKSPTINIYVFSLFFSYSFSVSVSISRHMNNNLFFYELNWVSEWFRIRDSQEAGYEYEV